MATYEMFFGNQTFAEILERMATATTTIAPGLGRERARDVAELTIRPRVGQTVGCGRFAECWAVSGAVWGTASPPVGAIRPCFVEAEDPNELVRVFASVAGEMLAYAGDQRDAAEERLAAAFHGVLAPLLFKNEHCGHSLVCSGQASSPFADEVFPLQPLGGNAIMSTLHVRDVMTQDVLAVSPDTSIETAARLFTTRHISGAPVVDADGKALGVVTRTDICDPDRDRSEHAGRSLYYRVHSDAVESLGDGGEVEGRVEDIMSPYVLAVTPDCALADAIKLMVMDEVHRLLVIEDNKLVGIVTSMDILHTLSRWIEKNARKPA